MCRELKHYTCVHFQARKRCTQNKLDLKNPPFVNRDSYCICFGFFYVHVGSTVKCHIRSQNNDIKCVLYFSLCLKSASGWETTLGSPLQNARKVNYVPLSGFYFLTLVGSDFRFRYQLPVIKLEFPTLHLFRPWWRSVFLTRYFSSWKQSLYVIRPWIIDDNMTGTYPDSIKDPNMHY